MGLSFDPDFTSLGALPVDLQALPLWQKVSGLIDHIVRGYALQFQDVKYKYAEPGQVNQQVIENIIDELGFDYITQVMSTITNYEFNTLLSFVSLLNLLKGSREGLELILILLGFDSVITEWWETPVKGSPNTFTLLLLMNSSFVLDPLATVDAVKIFVQSYVLPLLVNVTFQFSFNFADLHTAIAGFSHQHAYTVPGSFVARI